MGKDEIIALLETVVIPVYQIEANLGMPKTTLQKAIKGERILPKKWALKLLEVYPPKKTVNIMDLTVHSNKIEPKKPMGEKKSNFTINTSHKKTFAELKAKSEQNAIPRLEGESSIEYRLRMIEENKK